MKKFLAVSILGVMLFVAGSASRAYEERLYVYIKTLIKKEYPADAEQKVHVVLTAGHSRADTGTVLRSAFGWDDRTVSQFTQTFRSMQWDAFNEYLAPLLSETYAWSDTEREIFLTHSTLFLGEGIDILEPIYLPGEYTFSADASTVDVATILIDRILYSQNDITDFLRVHMDDAQLTALHAYVEEEHELLPDLVPLPPQDIGLTRAGGRTLLSFTTVYYNRGRGDLELIADPSTAYATEDVERIVSQRIYRLDGTYREREAGTFLWHQEHLHYHFIDFVEYSLTALDGTTPTLETLRQKSTFCIRDVSRVYLDDVANDAPAKFQVCGNRRQGVTVGWGDAYFNTYPDQNLDITGLPSGIYTLTFFANPADRFDEMTKDNNISSATIEIDTENLTATVLSAEPKHTPEFEHVHIEQHFSS